MDTIGENALKELIHRRDEIAVRAPRAVDVAVVAGVSTATVSRTFNAPDKVAPSVRDRVRAAAASLGWMPHAAGRALASNRTYIAGAVIPTLDDEIFTAQVGAMQAASPCAYPKLRSVGSQRSTC